MNDVTEKLEAAWADTVSTSAEYIRALRATSSGARLRSEAQLALKETLVLGLGKELKEVREALAQAESERGLVPHPKASLAFRILMLGGKWKRDIAGEKEARIADLERTIEEAGHVLDGAERQGSVVQNRALSLAARIGALGKSVV